VPHFQLTSPPETHVHPVGRLDGLKMALSLWTAEKLLGAKGDSIIGPGRESVEGSSD